MNIRAKIEQKEEEYIKELGNINKKVIRKQQTVSDEFSNITALKEYAAKREKEIKAKIKAIEIEILQADKSMHDLEEDHRISKHYEAHRLQILRDKQKVLSKVICKDSYQLF